MRKLLNLFFILIGFSSSAQITINSSDFIQGPDTVFISVIGDLSSLDFNSTGPNHVWDYTNVQVDSQRIDTFFNVQDAGIIYQFIYNNPFSSNYDASYYKKEDASAVPTAGLPIAVENPISFNKINTSQYTRVGLGVELNGIDVPITADTIDVVYEFPVDYNDQWTGYSYLFFDLNPAMNAMFKRHQTRISTVDGFGTLSTLYGNFEVLRVKSQLIYQDSVFFDLTGTGGSWIGVPSAQEIEYTWLAKDNKIPVLYLKTSIGFTGEEVTKAEFRDNIDFTAVEKLTSKTLKVYPNPAQTFLTIQTEKGNKTIQLYKVNGQKVLDFISKESLVTIPVAQFDAGLYHLVVIQNENTFSQKVIIE
ncbi:T9SS type A sorting domain-containing protein [Putridiphycobacter roseus]|nr:T9SS type A sorting domain-containing protein [Putridiphycobacter roseus]